MIGHEHFANRLATDLEYSGYIHDVRLSRAFKEVPRHVFLSEEYVREPLGLWSANRVDASDRRQLSSIYEDRGIVVKVKDYRPHITQTSPSTLATMIEALKLSPGMKLLEIGTGTGYGTALLKHIIGESGSVRSLEIDSSAAYAARQALRLAGYNPEMVKQCDGLQGCDEDGPYDRILVNSSVQHIPGRWFNQLTDSGILVFPRKSNNSQQLLVLTKIGSQLQGYANGFTYFPEIRRDPDQIDSYLKEAQDFQAPRDCSSLTTTELGERIFKERDNLDFRLYLDLSMPEVSMTLNVQLATTGPLSVRRPVYYRESTSSIVLGPSPIDGPDVQLFGHQSFLNELELSSNRWLEIGCPALQAYHFTAASSRLVQNIQSQFVWTLVPPSKEFLGWIIELTGYKE